MQSGRVDAAVTRTFETTVANSGKVTAKRTDCDDYTLQSFIPLDYRLDSPEPSDSRELLICKKSDFTAIQLHQQNLVTSSVRIVLLSDISSELAWELPIEHWLP